MFKLCYGNQMEALVDPLIHHIEASQAEDPLSTTHLIIPNPSIAQFVRFSVAQRLGVCANLEFHHLRRYLSERVQEADPQIRILEGESLQLLIFRQLNNPEVLQQISLEPVRTYLDIAESPEEREGRCVQLSAQLAALYEEYGYSRQAMLIKWRKGESTLTDDVWARTERWQRVLWRSLFDEEGAALVEVLGDEEPDDPRPSPAVARARRRGKSSQPALFYQEEPSAPRPKRRKSGPRWMFLPEAVRATASKMELPRALYVFGLSYVAPAFAETFALLSAYTDLHVYAMNPCCEFWEDIDNRVDVAREGWISRSLRVEGFEEQEDPFNLEDPNDTPALRLWGRPGREYIRLLNQLTDCEFEERFIEPKPETTLRALQRDILYRAPARPPLAEDAPLDGSLRLLACPGVRREVEIVADAIWQQAREAEVRGEPLRFHEIAVMVTDHKRQDYLTHIDAIFRERYKLPFNMIDRSLSAQSRVVEGVWRLLELPLGDFGYHQVIGVATHPCVGGALEGVNLDRWRRWGESLNIRFGADELDLEGTYVDRDVYHWDQGLRRLVLGAFMEGERAGDERLFEVGERAWVPFDVGDDGLNDAAQLTHLCRCLLLDAQRAKRERLTLTRWCMYFTRLLNRYIGATSPADEQALSRCLEAIEELKVTDLEGARISYEVAQSLLKGRLRRLESRRGQHQADGVVVSSMLPMRAIPFHTIYILGLGEQDFPAKSAQDPLDLRQAKPRPGDVSPAQRDRYLFLETLLCARSRLVLSYVASDDRTGDPIEPSAVVKELHFILRGYLGPQGLRPEHHPLSAYHLSYDWALPQALNAEEGALWGEGARDFKGGFAPPEVLRGIRAARLRASLNHEAGAGLAQRGDLEAAVKLWSRPELNAYLGVEAPPALEQGQGGRVRLSLSDLRAFLLSPLQGSARAMLGLREESARDEEAPLHNPLHMSYAKRFSMLTRAFWEGAGRRDLVAERYEDLFERASLVGEAPVGIFADEQRRRDGEVLSAWIQNLQVFQPPPLHLWRRVSVGATREFEKVDVSLPPLRLPVTLAQGGEVEVELSAPLSPLQPDLGGTLHCVPRGGVGEHLFLTGWLEMVALAAARQPLPRAFSVRLNPFGDNSSGRLVRTYATPTPLLAQRWLTEVLGELLQGFHAYRLPIKSVLHWREQLSRDPHAQLRVRPDEEERGPLSDLERFPTPPPSIALDMVRRRLGPWFQSELS